MTESTIDAPAPDKGTLSLITDLAQDLTARNTVSRQYLRYYDGEHPMPWVNRRAKAAYKRLMEQAITDVAVLVVDTLNDRLNVQGFRIGDESVPDDQVWSDLWERNRLDVYQPMVYQEAMCTGISYMSAWTPDGAPVRVRAESCLEVIHEVDPGDPLVTRSALKTWVDPRKGRVFVRLFEQDVVTYLSAPYDTYERVVSRAVTPEAIGQFMQSARWTVDQRIDNPFPGRVPIVPFLNRARMNGMGRSEFHELIPLFDRLNTIAAGLLLTMDVAAYKIRWATGVEIPRKPDGTPMEPFDNAVDRLWTAENPDAKFGQFDASPMTPYLESMVSTMQQIATISRTPPHMLLGNLTNLSADALKATESGQVQKAKNRARVFGESWEDIVGLYLVASGRDGEVETATQWADPENVSEGARVDALVKLNGIGLPWRAVMEKWGASPTDIERWESMRWQDALEKAMSGLDVGTPGGAQDMGGQQGQQQPSGEQLGAGSGVMPMGAP